MDLSELIPTAEPVWFTLTHVSTGADVMSGGKPVRLLLNGPDSPKMLAQERKVQQRRLTQAGRTGRVSLTPDELDSEATEQAVTALAGWEWEGLTIDGSPATFSPEAAAKVVGQVRWIRDWITEKLRDRGNFIGAPETTPTT